MDSVGLLLLILKNGAVLHYQNVVGNALVRNQVLPLLVKVEPILTTLYCWVVTFKTTYYVFKTLQHN